MLREEYSLQWQVRYSRQVTRITALAVELHENPSVYLAQLLHINNVDETRNSHSIQLLIDRRKFGLVNSYVHVYISGKSQHILSRTRQSQLEHGPLNSYCVIGGSEQTE